MEDMILDNPTYSNETDRISQLPEDIIGRILFFLPAKEAAGTSILSKKWLHVWDSLPVFSFRSDALQGKKNLLKQAGSFDDDADKYMAFIDGSLEKLRHSKVRIKIFQLELFESHERHSSRFNQFMELANKNHIKELVIRGLVSSPSRKKPSLPLATFASTNLFGVVDLKACEMRPELLKDEPRFPCLRKLYLHQVKLLGDNMVENLLASCPLLEEFSLKHCEVESVNLRDHPTLSKVWISGVGVIRVEAKHIRTFYSEYNAGVKPLELHIVDCNSIQELLLFTSYFTVEYIQELIARSPVLEKLVLRPCIPLERLKISSPSLRQLNLYTTERGGAKEVEIDAPNLQTYSYSHFVTKGEAKAATSPVLMNTKRLQVAKFNVYMGTHYLPTHQWFIQLKNYLESFEYDTMGIYVNCDMINKDSVLENLRQISGAPLVYLESLTVRCYWRSLFDFSALFDCCFWICRPKMISIDSNWGSNTEFIDLICDKLIPWEENPQCCRDSLRKCWRHDLEDVKIHKTITENAEYHPALPYLLPQSLERETKQITLNLKWKMSGRKRKIHSEQSEGISPILNLDTQEISPRKQRPRLFVGAVTKVLHYLADLLRIFNTNGNAEEQ